MEIVFVLFIVLFIASQITNAQYKVDMENLNEDE